MARKQRKEIRFVYHNGNHDAPFHSWERERLDLQYWDNESNSWGLICSATFTRSAEYPDEIDHNFVHFSMMKTVCNWIEDGYTLVGWFNAADL